MKYLLKFNLFLTAVIIHISCFPFVSSANIEVEETPITLNLSNTTTRDFLHEIEKQTNYSIKIIQLYDDETLDKILDTKKTIVLNQIPLDQALKRLLKDFNYSTISNIENNTLTIVLVEKVEQGNKSYVLSPEQSPGRDENESPTSGLDAAFLDYEKKISDQALTNTGDNEIESSTESEDQQLPTYGLGQAFSDYENKKSNQTLSNTNDNTIGRSEDRVKQNLPTSGLAEAFSDYENKKSGQALVNSNNTTAPPSADQTNQNLPTSGLEEAMQDYENKKSGQSLTNSFVNDLDLPEINSE